MYIDREKLLKQIEEPMNWTDSEAEIQALADYRAFKNMVEDAPTEDVVPRSEVEKFIQEIDQIQKDKAEVTYLKEQLVTKAKQEVAKQIFEEIVSKFHEDDFGDWVIDFMEFQELEKKYIGE